jgi:hypothetical protein
VNLALAALVLIASYAPAGGGVMLLGSLIVAVPSTLLVFALMLTSPARAARPNYWVALPCVAQPIPFVVACSEWGTFWPCFDFVWLGSIFLVFVGLHALVRPFRKIEHENSEH